MSSYMVIADGDVALRRLRALDEALVYECLEDWEPDELGVYTLARARNNVSVWLRQAAEFRQAGEGSFALVLERRSEPVGIAVCTVLEGRASVDLVAVHPDHRGQGLLGEMTRLLRVYGFEQLGIREVVFETRPDPLAVASEIELLGVREVGARPSPSGRSLRVWSYTAEDREAHLPEAEKRLRQAVQAEGQKGEPPTK